MDTTSLGVLQTFYFCMEGKFQPSFFVFMGMPVLRCSSVDTLLVLLIGLSFMISIIVCFIPSLGIMHQHLPTWTGKDLVLLNLFAII